MSGFWEGILGGGADAYGYKQLMDRMQTQRGDVSTDIDAITKNVQAQGDFTPWGVRAGGLGSAAYDPVTGQTDYQLNEGQRQQQSYYGNAAQDMYQKSMQMNPRYGQQATFYNDASRQAANRSMQDPTQREGDIYNRIRDMQRPGEERQRNQMTANLFGSGRGGMSSGAYGASPEEYGFNMARNEAMNQASLQAMGQAQTEMMNQGELATQYGTLGNQVLQQGTNAQQMYGQLGQSMYANQFGGLNALQGVMGLGAQTQQLQSQSDQNMAQILSELGLGGIGTELNYSNLENKAFGQLVQAGSGMLGGVGRDIDGSEGGLMSWLTDLFKRGEG